MSLIIVQGCFLQDYEVQKVVLLLDSSSKLNHSSKYRFMILDLPTYCYRLLSIFQYPF